MPFAEPEERNQVSIYSTPFWGSFWSILGGLFINVLTGHVSDTASTVQWKSEFKVER